MNGERSRAHPQPTNVSTPQPEAVGYGLSIFAMSLAIGLAPVLPLYAWLSSAGRDALPGDVPRIAAHAADGVRVEGVEERPADEVQARLIGHVPRSVTGSP